MALFARNTKPEVTEEYKRAERVLEQTDALCNCVLEYVDGTTDREKLMISEVNDKKNNAASLRESLEEGRLDPQMVATLAFALSFNQLLELVYKLDASTDEERELIAIAKKQLGLALQAGYGPAVELNRLGKLPL